ncbi:MAG: hypothetical protein E7202_03430 [Selenomonas ruminantium]|jgi:hypothetical protein|nr:hypothetical protein [Selenomonas ruminantium]
MNEEKLGRLNRLMPVEATEPSTADFLLTHVPFQNLYLDDQKSVSERELLDDYILKDMDEHKFIMVQGSNGTGKSHLIRWIYENYRSMVDTDREQIMFISRSHNTLQDAMAQLFASDIFPPEIREKELKALQGSGSQNTGEELKRVIGFNFTLEIEKRKDTVSSLKLRQLDQLKEYLMNEYVLSTFLMVSGGPLEKIRRKIETVEDEVQYGNQEIFRPEDFGITKRQIQEGLSRGEQQASHRVIKLATDLSDSMRGLELRQKVSDFLNSCVSNVIERSAQLQTSDFKQVFMSLREYLKKAGKTLTLFIEDINAFTGIDKALMEVLITNHQAMGNEDCCRLISVVGSTTDFYRNNINDSIKDRITTNVMIRDTSSEGSMLGSVDSRIRFAAAYLNAFHLKDAEIKEWIDEGMDSAHIPLASKEHAFSVADIDGHEMELFPFNVTALEAFFSMMPEHERSPRLFLRNVLENVLRLYYQDPMHFLSRENRFINKSVPELRPWKNPSYEGANRSLGERATERDLLLRMWGDATPEVVGNRIGGLSAEVFHVFDIPLSIQLGEEDQSHQPIPAAEQKTGRAGAEEVTPVKETAVNAVAEPKVRTVPIPNDDVEQQEALIRDWYAGKDRGHAAYRQVREAFQAFILDSIDWSLHEVPMVLVESCIKGTDFVLENSKEEERLKESFVIGKDEASRNMLTGIIHWRWEGKYSWSFQGADDYYIDAMIWLEEHVAEILAYATRYGMSIEELSAYYVAASYGVKSLFEPVEVKGHDLLEAAEAIFATPPTNEVTEGCGPAWKALGERVTKKNRNMDKVFVNALSLFKMGVGGGFNESSDYAVYDVMRVLEALQALVKDDWDVRKLPVREDINPSAQPGFCEIAPLALLAIQASADKALEESQANADRFLDSMDAMFAGDVNLEAIEAVQKEIKGFSMFLLNQMNKNNDDSSFRILYDMEPGLLYKAYVGLKRNRQGENPVLLQIKNNDVSTILHYLIALKSFEAFLSKYELEYSADVSAINTKEIERLSAEANRQSREILGMLREYERMV